MSAIGLAVAGRAVFLGAGRRAAEQKRRQQNPDRRRQERVDRFLYLAGRSLLELCPLPDYPASGRKQKSQQKDQ
jgi:hypothetical protein